MDAYLDRVLLAVPVLIGIGLLVVAGTAVQHWFTDAPPGAGKIRTWFTARRGVYAMMCPRCRTRTRSVESAPYCSDTCAEMAGEWQAHG